ncbi:MAG: triose-phosphate isomerase family protein [Patescibacteria group bacterium]
MKRLLVANWKMNPDTPREARALYAATKQVASKLKRTSVILCPPVVFLPLLKSGRNLALGAQDISTELRGAYTGSISAPMMKYAGAAYTIIGHSERRFPPSAFGGGDSDEIINKKIKVALGQGLRVILCIGERARDEPGQYLTELRASLERAVDRLPRAAARGLIIAYEPVWAISSQPANHGDDTPAGFLEQSIFIRKVLSHWCGRRAALELPILYGGSVGPKNASSFIIEGGANGLLVGHESLFADHWREIMRIVDRA